MRGVILTFCFSVAVIACPQDRDEGFPPLDMAVDNRDDRSQDDVEDGTCDDHLDCEDDELCFEDRCVDRDEALADCQDDDDCPEGFVCFEEDHCVEE